MKNLILLTLVSTALTLSAHAEETLSKDSFSDYLTQAVDSVESARKDALDALDNMVKRVDLAKENTPDNNTSSIETQIVETYAIAEIAKNTADVEIVKAQAMTQITQAVDKIDNAKEEEKAEIEKTSLAIIIKAVAAVEIAKANASKHIVEATQRVEVSKTQAPQNLEHAQETLSIAKNVAAVQIAKSVSDVEIAKSNSFIEIARSSMNSMLPTVSDNDKENIEDIKAEATAKISSYLTELEVLKAEISAKIAKEIAKVEIAEVESVSTKK